MTLEEFADVTRRTIGSDSAANYLPTACYPARRHITVLQNLPDGIDPEKPVLKWASAEAAENEEFLVGFKIDSRRFKIIRCVGPYSEDDIFAI